MERNKSLDGLKYILIVFVVIGHFIEPSRYNNQISCYLYSMIYSFHMPLFIWLSGYFYKHRTFKEEIQKCIPLLEVCLISHIAFAYLQSGELSLRTLLNFGYTPSWYVLSLVCWRLMSSLALEKISNTQLLVTSIILEVITFIAIPNYGGLLSIMRTFQFFPFFVLGYVLKGKLSLITNYKKVIIPLSVISLAYILYTSCRLQHQVYFQRAGLLEFTEYTDHSLLWIFLFRYSIIIISAFICALMLLFLHNNTAIQKVSKWGQGTLFVYFGQTLLYPFAVRYCGTLTLSLLASAVAIIILTYLSTKPISKVLMNPICTLFSKRKTN
ncbi:acyltransferase family protein [Bacteroides caecimuris]|uniref:acyltransferase family protein n=1 Tax=Bacteroides caecimuris TaxID=1796613 RepID=UPI001C3D2F5A|nr:acyltransferase family protein [Bacteroides caecimuris]